MQAADINDIWERILQVAKQTLPPAIYSSLSTSLIPMSIDNNSIACSRYFHREYCRKY